MARRYERLAALVFKHLDEREVVVHDLRLRGDKKRAVHQIDVVVVRAGVERRLLVECRDKGHGNKIEQGDVRDFYGVLAQLDADGIMLTTEGFTSGAINYALDERITLAILRGFRDEEDWEGRLRQINFEMEVFAPDPGSVHAELLVDDKNVDTSFTASVDPNNLVVIGITGEPSGSLADIIRDALGSVPAGTSGHVRVKHVLAAPTRLEGSPIGPITIAGILVEAEIEIHHESFIVDAGDRIAALVLETLDGEVSRVIFDTDLQRYGFDSEGRVLPR